MSSATAREETVESRDVVRVILQFLRENKLEKSMRELSHETGVVENTVENVQTITEHVEAGRWAEVLKELRDCEIPANVAWTLYEEMLSDLVCNGEEATAKIILGSVEELQALKTMDGERFDALQDGVFHSFSKRREKMEERWKHREKRRRQLAETMSGCLIETERSRLLALVGDALLWRKMSGRSEGLVEKRLRIESHISEGGGAQLSKSGSTSNEHIERQLRKRGRDSEDGVGTRNEIQTHRSFVGPGKVRLRTGTEAVAEEKRSLKKNSAEPYGKIKPTGKTITLTFGNRREGKLLVTGTQDGFIELWNFESGTLRTDLVYQANDCIMMHKKAILGLSLSSDDKLLASCSLDGTVKVWEVETGKCITRVKRAHLGKAVNCLLLAKDGSKFISGGDDHTGRIFGVESGNSLVELKGHQSQVNSVCFVGERETRALTGSSDQSVRIWEARTGQILSTISSAGPVDQLLYLYHHPLVGCRGCNNVGVGVTLSADLLFVKARSGPLLAIDCSDFNDRLSVPFPGGDQTSSIFISCSNCRGTLYCVSETGKVFSLTASEISVTGPCGWTEVMGLSEVSVFAIEGCGEIAAVVSHNTHTVRLVRLDNC